VIYENSSKKIHVPFKKGESEFVLHRRRNTLAQISLEEHLRVTAYCTWSNSLLSFRFNPADWALIHDTHQQKRYTCGTKQQIQLIVSRQTCAMSAFVGRHQQCRTCAHPHWRAACEKPTPSPAISFPCQTRVTSTSRPLVFGMLGVTKRWHRWELFLSIQTISVHGVNGYRRAMSAFEYFPRGY
jgi:hypothetical protein